MIICGIEISGSEARLVLLNGTKALFTHVNTEPRKIKIHDDEEQNEMKIFRDSIFSFLTDNRVELVAIKKRGKKGEYSGGPVGFKIEGIIQLLEGCPVSLIAPQTISAMQRKHEPAKPSSLKKYQYTAFETGFSALP